MYSVPASRRPSVKRNPVPPLSPSHPPSNPRIVYPEKEVGTPHNQLSLHRYTYACVCVRAAFLTTCINQCPRCISRTCHVFRVVSWWRMWPFGAMVGMVMLQWKERNRSSIWNTVRFNTCNFSNRKLDNYWSIPESTLTYWR